ncbi:Serine aminopeptidase, S33 [Sesbania bispinosa]|nr:Serine aminopeptidase, S33 [Sesbania bispinosa]
MALPAQNPGVEQQRVIVPNKHGEKLVGILHESGTREIVVLCHGFRSSKEANAIVNIAAALENAGISSFRFDFAGNGESDGSFQYGYYWREADDLHAITQHFHESNRVVTATVGHSKGGGVVLLYASKYHDVKTVVNLSGCYDLKIGIEERLGKDYMERIRKEGFIDVKRSGSFEYRVTQESLMDRLNTNMHEACLQIDKECRVLTVHGSSDTVIPVEDAFEFAKIIPNHRLHIIEGADHSYTNHQDELASVVVNFIKETLHQDRASAS